MDPREPKAGRPRRWAAGLLLCLVLVGVGALLRMRSEDAPYVVPTPTGAAATIRPAEAAATLRRLEDAVRDRDAGAARALAPSGDQRAAGVLAAITRNARALRVTDFTLRYVDDDGGVSPDGSWDAAVATTWQFSGFDRHPARAEVTFHLRNDGGRVAVTGVGGGGRFSPLWLAGPLRVHRTADTLVMVSGTPAQARSYDRHAAVAVRVVRQVLPGWHGGLVLEVPSSMQELGRTLDASPGTYDRIAGVTTAPDGQSSSAAPVHVFVNPEVFGRLKPVGAQVVLSHETTHVATHAYTSRGPLWLVEGFADYVALHDRPLPVDRSAARIIAEVRRDGAPRTLPTDADFGPAAHHLEATYESAWLACRLLAQDGGQRALVGFYKAVDGGTPVPRALRSSFDLGVPAFTRQWRTYLSHLAG